MFTGSNQIALAFPFEQDLRAWMNAVYEKALGDGFIRAPWRPDDTTVLLLRAYFHNGVSPADAVCACFCLKH